MKTSQNTIIDIYTPVIYKQA